jgi:hypothetical protein
MALEMEVAWLPKRAADSSKLYLLATVPRRLILGVKGFFMKEKTKQAPPQPKPFTPSVTRSMVRQHAYELFRDKLPGHPLTLDDWVMAEKDLVSSMDTDNLLK